MYDGVMFSGVGEVFTVHLQLLVFTFLSTPQSTEHQQTFIYSTASTTQPSHFAF